MRVISQTRVALTLAALLAATALGIAFAAEHLGAVVPCALCLLERWPYRIVIALCLVGVPLPKPAARFILLLVALVLVGSATMAGHHIGVETGWWPGPLPECAAPRLMDGTIAERLANMPLRPAKPCDEPTYLVPGLPVSIAGMNLMFSLLFIFGVATAFWRTRQHRINA